MKILEWIFVLFLSNVLVIIVGQYTGSQLWHIDNPKGTYLIYNMMALYLIGSIFLFGFIIFLAIHNEEIKQKQEDKKN